MTVTVSPKPGYSLKSLTAVEKDGTALDLADLGGGKYAFLMPAGKVTVTAEWETVSTVRHTFADVSADAYYADAVAWAVEKGITGGTGESTFSPDADCTRAQIVTFLWRAAGSPVVNYAMDFADVSDDAYYAAAVRWAVSEGITGGTGEGTFSPDDTCTRAQAVAFLYRSEQAGGGGMQGEWMFHNPFDDVDLESYYGEAVMWAVANGVTTGTGETTFSPHSGCTRGQIVTLLHRALGE